MVEHLEQNVFFIHYAHAMATWRSEIQPWIEERQARHIATHRSETLNGTTKFGIVVMFEDFNHAFEFKMRFC